MPDLSKLLHIPGVFSNLLEKTAWLGFGGGYWGEFAALLLDPAQRLWKMELIGDFCMALLYL